MHFEFPIDVFISYCLTHSSTGYENILDYSFFTVINNISMNFFMDNFLSFICNICFF